MKRMTGAELEAIKAALRVSDTWLAEALHVRRDTVFNWRRKADEPIPYRVPGELAAALRTLAGTADEWAERLEADYSST